MKTKTDIQLQRDIRRLKEENRDLERDNVYLKRQYKFLEQQSIIINNTLQEFIKKQGK
jgi:cell division protein FtsB